MDPGLGAIFIILNILQKTTFLVDREDISPAGVVVEWIAINVKGVLFGC